jgi:hypothetical protein
MELATWLLFVLGCLGGLDILLFHSIGHGIHSNKESANELVTHALRGPTYAALFVLVPNFALHGNWAWILIALFVVDVAISVFDFAMEGESRRKLGGLPAGEYVLHILMAMLFGALVMSTVPSLGKWLAESSAIFYSPAGVAVFLRAIMFLMAVLVLYSGLLDLLAVIRLKANLRTNQHDKGTERPVRASPTLDK